MRRVILRNYLICPITHHQKKRFTLAQQLFANGNVLASAEHMLHIVKHNRDFNDDAARKYLLEMVNSLDVSDPRISMIRRKLSALLFS